MRIAVASFQHESNTYTPLVTDRSDFIILRGDNLLARRADNCAFQGLMDTFERAGVDVVPLVFMAAVPGGVIERTVFVEEVERVLSELTRLMETGPLDAVALALHGSMRVETIGDAEGYVLARLRTCIADRPCVVSLDTHATMTPRLFAYASGLCAYKTAPHCDRYETGVQAAELTLAVLTTGCLHRAVVRVPFVVAGEQSATTVDPMRTLMSDLAQSERRDGILSASYTLGYPWADTPYLGAAALVMGTDASQVQSEALALARRLWAKRKAFGFETEAYPPDEALTQAMTAALAGDPLPIVVSDSGDNPTAGATSDGTTLLSLLVNDDRVSQLPGPVLVAGLYDPQATHRLFGRDGETVSVVIGAAFDTVSSSPLTLSLHVLASKRMIDVGREPYDVVWAETQGVHLVVASAHIGYSDDRVVRALGCDPATYALLIPKLGYLTPAWARYAKRAILALTPGATNERLDRVLYTQRPYPLYPLDGDFRYDETTHGTFRVLRRTASGWHDEALTGQVDEGGGR